MNKRSRYNRGNAHKTLQRADKNGFILLEVKFASSSPITLRSLSEFPASSYFMTFASILTNRSFGFILLYDRYYMNKKSYSYINIIYI